MAHFSRFETLLARICIRYIGSTARLIKKLNPDAATPSERPLSLSRKFRMAYGTVHSCIAPCHPIKPCSFVPLRTSRGPVRQHGRQGAGPAFFVQATVGHTLRLSGRTDSSGWLSLLSATLYRSCAHPPHYCMAWAGVRRSIPEERSCPLFAEQFVGRMARESRAPAGKGHIWSGANTFS